MDRPVETTFQRRRLAKRIAGGTLAVAALVALYAVAPSWITPTLARGRIRTALVDSGSIEATINASGTVVPETEQVLSSPIDSRVVRILKQPGALLKRGDPIVELDVSASVLDIEKINQSIALKQNQQARVKLDLDKTLKDLESQKQIKALELQSYRAKAGQNRKLSAEGLLSAEALRDAELAESKADIEYQRIEAEQRGARQSTDTQLQGLALEMETLTKERAEAERQLRLATMPSDRDGVLTWVIAEVGATVAKGAVVARIADLGSFRVDATVSDMHMQRLAAGMPVQVKANDQFLSGSITTVLPTIQNGTITLHVQLDDKSSPLLKANLGVDVLIVAERRDRALRVKKGPSVPGEGAHDVFVLRGDRAERVRARFGITSFDTVEVLDGLAEGDEIIISDMADYAHLRGVAVSRQ